MFPFMSELTTKHIERPKKIIKNIAKPKAAKRLWERKPKS